MLMLTWEIRHIVTSFCCLFIVYPMCLLIVKDVVIVTFKLNVFDAILYEIYKNNLFFQKNAKNPPKNVNKNPRKKNSLQCRYREGGGRRRVRPSPSWRTSTISSPGSGSINMTSWTYAVYNWVPQSMNLVFPLQTFYQHLYRGYGSGGSYSGFGSNSREKPRSGSNPRKRPVCRSELIST